MMTLNDIIKLLHDRKATVVAKETGLSYQTVWRIAKGDIRTVNYETAKKLSDYFQKEIAE